MSTHLILVALGALLVLAGIVGGGLALKELKLPTLNSFSRILACVFGVRFILVGIYVERDIRQREGQEPQAALERQRQ